MLNNLKHGWKIGGRSVHCSDSDIVRRINQPLGMSNVRRQNTQSPIANTLKEDMYRARLNVRPLQR